MKKELLNYMNLPNKKAVLLQSGGLDSNICAAMLTWAGFKVVELFVDYGQSALDRELEMAEKICEYYGHKLVKAKIDIPWFKKLPIVGGTVKSDGVEEIKLNKVDPESYIPLRNHLLISMAGSLAESLKYEYICSGLNGQQNILGKPTGGFVDAHKNFAISLEKSMSEGSTMKHQYRKNFKLLTPLMGMNKSEVITLGFDVGADMSKSWSCYNSGEVPCLHCSSCIGRAEGFALLIADDPLLVELGVEMPKENLFQ